METMRSGRPAEGTSLNLPGIGPVIVEANTDPSLVILKTARGGTFRIGEKALAKILEDHTHAT